MQNVTIQDIIVVAAVCLIGWFIGRYIKRKNEREEREWREQHMHKGETENEKDTDNK